MTASRKVQRPPVGLGPSGGALWRSIVKPFELAERELALLEAACRQHDLNTLLEAQIAKDGLMVPGSVGQQRLHPAATEVRQGRLALGRLLADIHLPDAEDAEQPATPRQARARHAANARWQRQASLRGIRGSA